MNRFMLNTARQTGVVSNDCLPPVAKHVLGSDRLVIQLTGELVVHTFLLDTSCWEPALEER